MQELVLEEGRADEVARLVRESVESLGGAALSAGLSRIRFDGLRPAGEAFARAGAVGLYQPFGTPELTIRVRAWALWPRRLLTLLLASGIVATILLFVLRPDEGTWFLAGAGYWLGLALLALVYAGTLEASRELERRLAEEIAARLRALPGARVWGRAAYDAHVARLFAAAKAKAREARTGGATPAAEAAASAPTSARRERRVRRGFASLPFGRGRREEE